MILLTLSGKLRPLCLRGCLLVPCATSYSCKAVRTGAHGSMEMQHALSAERNQTRPGEYGSDHKTECDEERTRTSNSTST